MDPSAFDAFIAEGLVDEPDGSVRLSCRPEDEAALYASPVRYTGDTDLSRVACPVHLAHGSKSPDRAGDSVRYVAGVVALASVTTLAGLTHAGPFEAPALVASWIAHIEDADGN